LIHVDEEWKQIKEELVEVAVQTVRYQRYGTNQNQIRDVGLMKNTA